MLSMLSESQARHILGSSSSCSYYISSLHLHCGLSDSWLLYKMFAYTLIKKDLSGWARDDWRILSPLARFEYLNRSLMLLLFLFVRGNWKMKEADLLWNFRWKFASFILQLSKAVKSYSNLHQRATSDPSPK